MSWLGRLFRKDDRTEAVAPSANLSETAIAEAASTLKIEFPPSFLSFLKKRRNVRLPACAGFYWIGATDDDREIVAANCRERTAGSLPGFLVAFYNDGMGNQVCFDTRRPCGDGEYPIVFWDHELSAEENLAASERSAETPHSCGIVARSFGDWLALELENPT